MKKLTLFIVLLLAGIAAHAQSTLPPFEFEGTEGKKITFNDMPKGKTLYVLFFSPDCDHCNKQASLIAEKISLFDNAAFLWVNAFHELPEIAAFQKKYFEGKSNFFFAKDSDWRFDAYFGESQVPSIYVYDPSGKRIASYTSTNGHFEEPSAEKLAEHLYQ